MYAGKDAVEAARLLLDHGAKIDTRCDGNPLIQQAIHASAYKCLRLFMERGAPRDQLDEFGYLPLHCAAYFGRTEAVKILLDAGDDIEKKDSKGRTPLQCAWDAKSSFSSHVPRGEEDYDWLAAETFIYLLDRGANSKGINWNSFEPLQRAAQFNVPILIYELARRGFNVATMDSNGQTGLHIAARYGHYRIAKLLLDCGAKVDARRFPFVPTPLLYASIKNHPDIAKLLIERGAQVNRGFPCVFDSLHSEYRPYYSPSQFPDLGFLFTFIAGLVDLPDAAYYHPINAAAVANAPEIIEMLIQHGVMVDQTDSRGRTPVDVALLRGSANAARVLITNGADLAHLDKRQNQYLARIVSQNSAVDVTEKLLDAGFQVNAPCSDKYTPAVAYGRLLIIAADDNSPANIRLLTERGADVKALNSNGWTALHLAAFRRSFESIKALLAAGAEVDAITEKPDQRTALGIASEKGDAEIVKLLLAAGARVGYETIKSGVRSKNAEVVRALFDSKRYQSSRDGLNNLLFEATRANSIELAKLLIEQGADINAVNKNSVSVLHYSLGLRWLAGARFLLESGAKVNTHDVHELSPLSEAFFMQDHELLETILKVGGDPNDRARLPIENSPTWPLIRHFIETDDTTGVKFLLKFGVSIDSWTINNAILKKREWITDKLLDEAANPNRKWYGKRRSLQEILSLSEPLNAYDEFDPQTPLAMAVMAGNCRLVKKLVFLGSKVDFPDCAKITPLHRAAITGNIEIARYLLEQCAKVNAKDSKGRTPLAWIVKQVEPQAGGAMTESERLAMARLLLFYGAQVNIIVMPDHESEIYAEPLVQSVVKYHSIAFLKLLIEHGADVNVADPYQNTSIHTAIKLGKKEAIPILIAAGANLRVLNGERRSAFGLAKEQGASDVLEMLAKGGKGSQ